MKTTIAILIAAVALSAHAKPLTPPKAGPIPVAVVLNEHATMIDFAGPWEVFQDVDLGDRQAFKLYTVSEKKAPIHTSGGMTVIPDYTFADAPAPKVVVIGAQMGGSPEMMEWIRRMTKEADVVMSVCTGAFKLGKAGVLDGKEATTHHDFYEQFEKANPKVKLVRSKRFVESDDVISTAGGLTSGIDLALHVVERYFGREVAQRTADYMEYEGTGWKR